MAAADTPKVSPLGLVMAAPVLVAFGTAAQKERWLPDIRNGVSYWCQGYSEPNAGSDLANVQTRAVLDGDEWVDGMEVVGATVWSCYSGDERRDYQVGRG